VFGVEIRRHGSAFSARLLVPTKTGWATTVGRAGQLLNDILKACTLRVRTYIF
jgi:hypothetical protein